MLRTYGHTFPRLRCLAVASLAAALLLTSCSEQGATTTEARPAACPEGGAVFTYRSGAGRVTGPDRDACVQQASATVSAEQEATSQAAARMVQHWDTFFESTPRAVCAGFAPEFQARLARQLGSCPAFVTEQMRSVRAAGGTAEYRVTGVTVTATDRATVAWSRTEAGRVSPFLTDMRRGASGQWVLTDIRSAPRPAA